jgi:hypothetical protein
MEGIKIGMLWFNNDGKQPLSEKIIEAADFYYKKYSKKADLVYVHPTNLPDQVVIDGIEVRTSTMILPNHLWLGVKSN